MGSHSTFFSERLEQKLADLERRLSLEGVSPDILHPLKEEMAETRKRLDADALNAKRFKFLAEALNDWIWEVDAEGRFTFVSDRVSAFLGYEPEELLGRTPFDFMPPEEAARVGELFGGFIAEKKPFSGLENVTRHRDGHLVTLKTSGVPLFNDDGNIAGYIGSEKDVGDERRVMARLHEVEEEKGRLAHRMETAVDASRIGIWELDLVSNQLSWTDWMYRLYGIDRDRFTRAYEAWENGLHPDDRAAAISAVDDAIAGKKPFDTEFRVVTPSGEVRYLKAFARVMRDESGKPIRMTGVNYDITERRELEQEVAKKALQLERLYNGITDAVVIADVETRRLVHCNHVAERMFERECSALTDMTVESLHPEDMLDELLPAFQRQAEGLQRVIETEVLTASGKRIPVSILASTVEYNDRPALMGVFRDITESKDAERQLQQANSQLTAANQQLQASEQQLKAANQQLQASEQQLKASNQQLQAADSELRLKHHLQSMLTEVSIRFMTPDGGHLDENIEGALSKIGTFAGADRSYVFLISEDGRFISNTHEWCAEGIAAQKELLQDVPLDSIPWWIEQHQQMLPIFIPSISTLPEEAKTEKELLENQKIQSLLSLPMADGSTLKGFVGLDWVRRQVSTIRALDIPSLQLGGDMIFGAMIRNASSRKLQEREAKYRALFESVQDIYIVVDTDSGIIEEVSPSIQQLGYDRKEVLHTKAEIFYHDPKEREHLYGELLKNEKLHDFEVHIRRKDGSIATMSLAISLQQFAGQGLKTVSSLRDITLRKEHELQIQENLKLKNNFISSVSHELRTPLFSILGFSSTLLKQGDAVDKGTRNEFISIIHDESIRLSALIEDLLTISRIESGSSKYKSERINPVIVVSGVVDVLKREALEKKIQFIEVYPETQIFINFDKDSLKQILINLLGNALKFSPKGGQVEIRIKLDGQKICIDVEDNGIGIPASELELIFEKFYRVEHDGNETNGTGLGLAIVKDILNAQNGTINVTSEVGRGSCFRIELAVAPDEVNQG